jgi:L-alanine-DL-glutamate epimerase-like enolase superfamily enzyme
MRELIFSTESWAMKVPFRITGHVFTEARVLHVKVLENGCQGRGEASGVYYLDETPDSMLAQAEAVRPALERGADREALRDLLPAGGARNAIDCALWDLEAKLSGQSIWELTGIQPRETITVNTVGIDTIPRMAAAAQALDTPKIKVKLDGDVPLERITAVREARPDAEIVVDVNQGWTFEQLVDLAPRFRELGVAMIEQPLPRGGDAALEGYRPPIPLCADESCLYTKEFDQAARRYQMINIKLDKTGGLTEALDLAALAQAEGIGLMVGNMVGTSLAMAPGFVIAQLCRFVDLDGALFLKQDREHPMAFHSGVIAPPSPELWG